MNKDLYRDGVIKKAVFEDKDWIKEVSSASDGYVSLRLKTSEAKDVFNWLNYLIYLHKD